MKYIVTGSLLAVLCLGQPTDAQEQLEIPVLLGLWQGDFESYAETAPSGATTQRTQANLHRRFRVDCKGTASFTFSGRSDAPNGNGLLEQSCDLALGGPLTDPSLLRQELIMSDIEIKKDGKEIRFEYHPSQDKATVCKTKMKWKMKEQVFEGEFDCLARGTGASLMDRITKGKFVVIRQGYGSR